MNGNSSPDILLPGRELIVIADSSVRLRAMGPRVASVVGADVNPLNQLLAEENVSLEPLFGTSERRLEAERTALAATAIAGIPDLSVYYTIRADDSRLEGMAEKLAATPGIVSAYVKPAAQLPFAPPWSGEGEDPDAATAFSSGEAPPVTADFSSRQGYLGPAPEGVDAQYAATQAGGGGAGVGIIDIEGDWNFAHEDLKQNQGGIIGGTPINDLGWRNHGTAVVGEFGADKNSFGVLGISPDASVRAISFYELGTAAAIRQAADALAPGDVILIELHRPGPRFNFQSRTDQRGYIAIEWWPDDLAAIQYAVAKGAIVVEAAGNGGENFDDALYDQLAPGFPSSWKNPLNPANPSSGAVVVGAGAPPPGTHGHNIHGPDRSRLDFSNYGARVDAQGWGREVTTTGYGDLQGGSDENLLYTDKFSGTSSASPIVVGAIASIQGILGAAGQSRMTPAKARDVLRKTGSPQQDAPGRPATQRIGNRPDIKAAVAYLSQAAVSSGVATQYWIELLPYPPGSTASLWLLVGGGWKHYDNPPAHLQQMVQGAFLGGANVRVWYDGGIVVGLVVDK